MARLALVAGATGAVGGRLLARLLAREDGTRVLTVGRRAPSLSHLRLEHVDAQLPELERLLADRRCTEAYCCLGTTMRQAGDRAGFRAVDFDGVAAFARAARAAGAGFLGLVSSAGADPRSRSFYLRTKGEAEAVVEALGFRSLAILQPGLLRGRRAESRPGEALGQRVAPLLDRLMIGRLSRFRSATVESVAGALDVAGRRQSPGTRRMDASGIARLAGGA